MTILAGNLEEGLRDDADRTRHVSLALPVEWQGRHWQAAWGVAAPTLASGVLPVMLAPQGSTLLQGR